MSLNFTTYASIFKTDYVPKALDTLVYSDRFLDRVIRYPFTQAVMGKNAKVPFDLRRYNTASSTFSDSQALSKIVPASDIDQRWEIPVASISSVVRISNKALRAGASDEGAIFKTIMTAGNKALAGVKLRVLSDIFSDTPGKSGQVNVAVTTGKKFALKSAEQVANFDKGDQIEFRTAAGAKKGSGYATIDSIELNVDPPTVTCAANLPALAPDDLVYRRGDYGKTIFLDFLYGFLKRQKLGVFLGLLVVLIEIL